jgi:hypothetical protein
MKKLILILTVCCLCCWAFASFATPSVEVSERIITFHQVNLVCSAATDIGCGSRSKPILLDLEKEEEIKEAWLNRPGTIVAIVWEDNVEPRRGIVSAIFKKHGKTIETLAGAVHQEQLASFRSDKWYRGAEVDQLSMEEAGRIASQFVDPLVAGGILSEEDAPKMHAEVEKFIQNEFMTLEDVSLLNTTTYYDGWEKEITKIGEKYVGAGNMPEMELCTPSSSSCKKESKASCTKDKSSCCSKSGT